MEIRRRGFVLAVLKLESIRNPFYSAVADTCGCSTFILTSGGVTMAETAYCVKCKEKREMLDAEKVTMKNGRPAMKGKCSVCGTGMYKILPKQG